MKAETLIYDKIKKVIPDKSEKTIIFVGMTNSSHEVYFYSFIEGRAVQCYTLAEQYELDENELAEIFSNIVKILRQSKYYHTDEYNVGTINIDKCGITITMEYYDMEASEYKIQKEWKKTNIG